MDLFGYMGLTKAKPPAQPTPQPAQQAAPQAPATSPRDPSDWERVLAAYPINHQFCYLGRTLLVLSHRNHEGWVCLECEYADSRGKLHEWYFYPRHAKALLALKAKPDRTATEVALEDWIERRSRPAPEPIGGAPVLPTKDEEWIPRPDSPTP